MYLEMTRRNQNNLYSIYDWSLTYHLRMQFHYIIPSALKTGVEYSCHVPAQRNLKEVHTEFLCLLISSPIMYKLQWTYYGIRMSVATKLREEQYFT
jgi:hypothetical protein